jgi:hypothetical protein
LTLWRCYLYKTISEIKKIIDENQYVSDKDVTEEKLVYSDKCIIYISKGTLEHIKSHMAPSVELGDAPGSYYTQNWKKGVETVISKFEPEVGDKPPFRTAWTGKDAGIDVGFVTIGHDDKLKSDELDGFKSYTYERPVRDTKVKETIILKEEEATKTNFLTVVGAKIGEVEGKGLITLWTTYPDFQDGKIDGKEIPMNRNEFKQNGFYFKCSKEFFDKVPSEQVSESKTLKYLKTFESFVNEDLNINADYDLPDLEAKKKQLNDLFPYDCIDSSHYKIFGYESEEDFENAVKWGEIDPERILRVIKDEVGDLFPGFEVDGGVYHGDEECYITVRKGDERLSFDLKFDI